VAVLRYQNRGPWFLVFGAQRDFGVKGLDQGLKPLPYGVGGPDRRGHLELDTLVEVTVSTQIAPLGAGDIRAERRDVSADIADNARPVGT